MSHNGLLKYDSCRANHKSHDIFIYIVHPSRETSPLLSTLLDYLAIHRIRVLLLSYLWNESQGTGRDELEADKTLLSLPPWRGPEISTPFASTIRLANR